MKIKFNNISSKKKNLITNFKNIIKNGVYLEGKYLNIFEKSFSKFNNSKFSIGVNSGTDALEIILRAHGVKYNDHVLVPSHTAIATVSAIRRCGGIPIFVDIEKDTFTMCPKSLKKTIFLCNKKKKKN